MNHQPLLPFFALSLLLFAPLQAEVVPAVLFQDNAILQHGKPVPVWGTADPNEKITVDFAGQSVTTTANADGKWILELKPMEPSSVGRNLTIEGSSQLVLEDVLVGEVWIASGQSNMVWTINNSRDRDIEVLTANWPHIRELQIQRTVSDTPALTVENSGWRSASPETLGAFSAVAYFFARDLHQALDIPVGIINSSWGGTRVEAWLNPLTSEAETGPAFATMHERWSQTLAEYPEALEKHKIALAEWEAKKTAAEAANEPFNARRPREPWGPGHQATPSGLYNAMIHPLIPYSFRGAIWYQGESNTGRADEYRELFTGLITGWREAFDQGDFPFYWVQLANFRSLTDTSWAFLREAQTQTLDLPETGQAIIIDIGDVTDIHPRNKQDVGRRLARLAFNRTYGIDMPDSGPVFEKAEREGNGFRVHFSHTNRGLKFPSGTLSGFELAGEDQVFHFAEATIDGTTVIVTSEMVPEPVAVRYAWRNAPKAGLFNGVDLPAAPFRSDNW